MKRKDDIFKTLENADDKLIDTLANEYHPVSEEQKKRILEKSESKIPNKGQSAAIVNYDSGIKMNEIENHNKWYRHLGKIAASFVGLIAVGSAVMFALNTAKPGVPVSHEENIEVQATNDTPKEKASVSSVSKNADTETVSSKDSGSNSETVVSSDSKKESTESHEESSFAENTEKTGSENTDNNTDTTDTNQDEIDIAIDDTDYNVGYTGKNRVLAVTDDMTYGQVIELLGAPDDLLIQNGFAMYRVESDETDRLLYLFYDNPDDVIGKNGHQLYEEAIPIDQMYFDLEHNTFECVVVQIHDGGSVRVSCPQYSLICADFRYTDDPSLMDLNLGDRVIVTYTGYALEVYPCIIEVTNVEVVNDKTNWAIDE